MRGVPVSASARNLILLSVVMVLVSRGVQAGVWRMPDEAEPHECTWMSFVAKGGIWGRKRVPGVWADLANIARAIATYEPVRILVDRGSKSKARQLLGGVDNVELIDARLDDLWMRDSGPVFVKDTETQKLAAVNFNFNGWGKKQVHRKDAKVAGIVTDLSDIRMWVSKVVMEGGGVEVDGHGTAIATESSIVNDNRNLGLTRAEIECYLKEDLGLEKIIWLPGIKNKDITDGHVDFYARFAAKGKVVVHMDNDRRSYDYDVTRENVRILSSATDVDGTQLEVIELVAPDWDKVRGRPGPDCAAGYVNFYVINGAVLVPQFGDTSADSAAQAALGRLFPDRDIVALNIDNIANGGGGIHCTAQQQPEVEVQECRA
mmetsp:Transcript_23936/g.66449  ORF Transcript_23936/g.66449 Transcript_23936/m.66449 type:complete len:375 (+) Transcript_23936:214-1338(+)|eukprot:CAMPEP_0117663330 /NCGR_PEP_ID=MMETSP0804-20121206/8543_1 /TAXON_ID=1074897 /ORGANISM="Tetraselmis astigmatica, Strain CCMP880" /LENGTH=374 /DNA_ID=CAMNT_0005470317 /DNA_START=172 /DNA_END=1296 /DNA_ORIENTATION=+